MKPRKFDIGFGYLGNGTTVYNRAREVDGDLERVAHISEEGVIRWRIEPRNLPVDAVRRIMEQAKDPAWMHPDAQEAAR